MGLSYPSVRIGVCVCVCVRVVCMVVCVFMPVRTSCIRYGITSQLEYSYSKLNVVTCFLSFFSSMHTPLNVPYY